MKKAGLLRHTQINSRSIVEKRQCFDAHMDSPIPGLQYVMGTDTDPELYDTIVMANLGYFQLKGKPGAWKLRLREGRSSEVYQISSYYQSRVGSGGNVSSIPVNVSSFTGNHLIVRVTKKPGMEKASLLLSKTENQQATPTGSTP
ncbi:PREDICTED: UDP-glucose:glycoprotein glucosyltransferase-like [Amphimedon queenslandica]|uniref:Uncharacterized protein n=1 Tax=Amphimedon queenslandica TaxID=400682 RepID=A0AAN0JMX1_AMPQE|nr:PREDICTED: UDP-glucose:glycoprotein glucosyltransferase-like [Amphimedon queenslandica]|eukprot:XP_019858132.1 PREDICTED: UDP-glucose:glycoprotein glucosyltransferase-like [Amphimedon queenslandica]